MERRDVGSSMNRLQTLTPVHRFSFTACSGRWDDQLNVLVILDLRSRGASPLQTTRLVVDHDALAAQVELVS